MKSNRFCWKCRKEIDTEDIYCKYCGKKQDETAKFFYTVFGVLILFLAVGPFCLFNLWKSPIIKKDVKKIVTIIITLISAFFIFLIIRAVSVILNYYMSIFNL